MNWPNFIVCLPLICEILSNMFVVILCYPGCDVTNFRNNLIFLIKLYFLHAQKVKTKMWISSERKRIGANNFFFLEGESPTLIYIWNYVFQQSATCKITIFSIRQAQTDGLSDDAKASKFLSYNLPWYNIEKLIWTL